jgi:predicted ATPase
VLLSAATAALVRDALPAGVSLRPLGVHPLRGLSSSEEVYQLCHPDLPTEFPPLLSPGAPRHNLPLAANALIGRESEQGEVLALLAQARLVTLTGSGGVGKTRLALAVAGELVDQYVDGVWLVELAALAEERLVPQAVLEALGAREEAGRPLLATLSEYLKVRHLLLVVDNCEHLIAACAALAGALLRSCPRVRILATSREGLAVAGEQCYRVPSLPVPDPAHLPAPEELTEAAALFVIRARERRPDFALTAANAPAIAEVCARLDGIPLALELAAARVDSLGVAGIVARLDDRFRLLTGGNRDVLPRQRTLRAALEWSYDLLSEPEQLLLDRLAVFAGGWTLAAAEAICAGDGVEQWEILDLLAGLVHKSLVQATEVAGDVRYGLLETVRQYGQERLGAAGNLELVRDGHLRWYMALAEEAAPHLWGAEQVAWLDRLETEHDNLRAALRWAQQRNATEEALRLAGSLGRYRGGRGYMVEGLGWLEGALAAGVSCSNGARALALMQAGDLASWQGEFERGATLLEESLALSRAMGDDLSAARAPYPLGQAFMREGEYARASPLFEEALALYQEAGDRLGAGFSLSGLAWLAFYRGEYDRAKAVTEESMAQFRQAGDRPALAYATSQLAHVVERRGTYDWALSLLDEALALWQDARHPSGSAWVQMNRGWCLLALGENERATALLEESLATARRTGHFSIILMSLMYLGWAAYLRGEHAEAAGLLEEALAQCRRIHNRFGIESTLVGLACVLQARGDFDRAGICLREGLLVGREIGTPGPLADLLEAMSRLAAAEGQTARAARLGGAAEAQRVTLGQILHPVLHAGHDQAVQSLHDALGEQAFTAAWAAGQELSLEQAIAYAVEAVSSSATGPAFSGGAPDA